MMKTTQQTPIAPRSVPTIAMSIPDGFLSRVPLQQAPRDHEALDLVRALADDHQRSVPVVALDGELRRVSVAAVDAERGDGDLAAHLRREELRHARFEVRPLAGVFELR